MAVPVPSTRAMWSVVGVLTTVVLVFFVLRPVADVPPLVAGTVPKPTAFEQRYVPHPVTAYVHIVLGVSFLLGALFQLSGRLRLRHLAGTGGSGGCSSRPG